VPGRLVRDLVEHSYRLVVAKLRKADRIRIEAAEGYPAAPAEDG
jgi:predicted DNA-binding protein (MmcQ/YjbR family)